MEVFSWLALRVVILRYELASSYFMVIMIISESTQGPWQFSAFPKAGKLKWDVFTKEIGRLFESWLHGVLIEDVSSEHNIK